MSHCANCGASLPHGAEFCPRCGANLTVATPVPDVAPAAPPPAAPASAAPAAARPWCIVPLVIIALVIVAFAVMLLMPFGGREEGRPAREVAETDTVEEGAPAPARPAETGTLVDLGQPPPAATTTTAMAAPPPVTTTVVTTPPPPPIEIERTPAPAPAPVPAPAPAEISEGEAVATLRGYVTSRRYYDVGPECIGIASAGYRNAGYTLEVQDTCNSRSLGNWRVDSKTREVFRQREDGRYLRP